VFLLGNPCCGDWTGWRRCWDWKPKLNGIKTNGIGGVGGKSKGRAGRPVRVFEAVARLLFVALMAAVLVVAFVKAPGTYDVFACIQWIKGMGTAGPFAGYRALIANYPPLSVTLMWISLHLGHAAGLSDLLSYKASVAVFTLTASVLVWWWNRSSEQILLLLLLVMPFGLVLGYYDVVYLPFLQAALYAAGCESWGLAGLLLAIAGMIKWQPMILAPIFLIAAFKKWPGLTRFGFVVGPTAIFLAVIFLIFGSAAILRALSAAMRDEYLSGQGANVGWLLSYVFETLHYDGLQLQSDGAVALLQRTPSVPLVGEAMIVLRFLFYGWFLVVLCVYAAGRKSRDAFLLAALACSLVQFTWNTGVHENHFFVPMIIAFVAWQLAAVDSFVLTAVSAVSVLNVLIFYGFDDGFNFAGFFGIDPSVILAVAELVLFGTVFGLQLRTCLGRHDGVPAAVSLA
jgi:hypothetical protein